MAAVLEPLAPLAPPAAPAMPALEIESVPPPSYDVPIVVYRVDPLGRALRRAADIAIASAGLALSGPILLAAIAAIALEDGRPVFFQQRRVGRFERTFPVLKLRTMRKNDCGDRLSPRGKGDSRITRVGAILRKLSIDELPQLINVLRGEMSIVGPRPEMPFVVRGYAQRWQHLRHLAVPGITCIWQTTVRKTVPLERPEATLLDIDYLVRKSPLVDARIIAGTATAVLFPKGAY